jgi:hypothetical protein
MPTHNIRLAATTVVIGGQTMPRQNWTFIVDTGSNVSLVHARRPDKFGGTAKTITFHNKDNPHHQGYDVPVSIHTKPLGNERVFVIKGIVSVVNLNEAIPSFPMRSRQGLIGTNLLWDRRVQVSRDKCMRILRRGPAIPPGFVEVEGVVPCVDPAKKKLGPLLTVRVEDRLFLVDTGNLRSTFCVTEGMCKDKRGDCTTCTATIALKDGSKVDVEGDVLSWEPQSLVNIPCGAGGSQRPSGNLGLDVWIGLFESTIFEFGPKGSRDHKIFCRMPSNRRSRVHGGPEQLRIHGQRQGRRA